ncbi:adenosylmethionine decarboxylase [Candidatus Micrarchaeota archaeon CG10_big_fil_rev_8_21_14_0_10_45_29]|nr:MAG: adenosylmethionine decarboxylase [Candidatus Micrarchaeota archaeon CG10_big_fil_rev_8_21_14_0_10_45_29]
MFGPHLTLDMYGCDKNKIGSVEYIHNFLDKLPKKIGMDKIMPPNTFRYESPKDWGVTGVVLIAQSHIAIHTFPEVGYVSFDIFSCKDFDTEKVTVQVIKALGAKTYEKNMFDRGRHFPKDYWRNMETMSMQRSQKKAMEVSARN